jgi:predicted lipid-binding transport protein (Tim44 family)
MHDVFDIYTIIFLALAVFIFLRLRSVLGTRTGRERPPYDPYSARDAAREPNRAPAESNILPLPNRANNAEKPAAKPVEVEAEPADRWEGVAAPGTPLAASLDAIAAADQNFDAHHFVAGARAAYEMIVNAFAEGDRRTLKNLLSRDVYEGFESAITERERRHETMENRFVSLDTAEISTAEMRGRTAQLTMRFHSKLITATRDKNGNVIDGSAERVSDVTDVWTFARDVSSRDPNWKLVATEAGH